MYIVIAGIGRQFEILWSFMTSYQAIFNQDLVTMTFQRGLYHMYL